MPDSTLIGVGAFCSGTCRNLPTQNREEPAERRPVCFDLATGEVRWRERGYEGGFPLLVDGKLIFLTGKGELIIAEATPEALNPIVETQVIGPTTWGPPAFSDGKLYVRNESGDLACWQIARSAPTK